MKPLSDAALRRPTPNNIQLRCLPDDDTTFARHAEAQLARLPLVSRSALEQRIASVYPFARVTEIRVSIGDGCDVWYVWRDVREAPPGVADIVASA